MFRCIQKKTMISTHLDVLLDSTYNVVSFHLDSLVSNK